MTKKLKNTLPAAMILFGMIGFFVHSKAATDSLNLDVTVAEVVTLSASGGALSIAGLVPGVTDTSQSNTLTAAGNDPEGFSITVSATDKSANPDQLCEDNGSGNCAFLPKTFPTDGIASYISFTSSDSTIGAGTFTTSETKLDADPSGAETVFTHTAPLNSGDITVAYDVFADSTITPVEDGYTGTITYTIVGN